MMGSNAINSDGHTAREEAEGKEIWEKLQAKILTCKDLSDDNFGALGEYFMGQMMGDSHEAMNNMMIQMMGEEGEEQMHIAMGKRMSNCEPDAPMPQNMPAPYGIAGSRSGMNGGMMGGSGNSMMGNFGTNPMGWVFGFFGWIFMILWWFLIVLGIVAIIKWLAVQSRGSHDHEKSPSEILEEVEYQCPECGLKYKEKEWAEKCEAWCKKYKSCNLEIIKHAIKSS